jgi:uncharacterized integral membrane protein
MLILYIFLSFSQPNKEPLEVDINPPADDVIDIKANLNRGADSQPPDPQHSPLNTAQNEPNASRPRLLPKPKKFIQVQHSVVDNGNRPVPVADDHNRLLSEESSKGIDDRSLSDNDLTNETVFRSRRRNLMNWERAVERQRQELKKKRSELKEGEVGSDAEQELEEEEKQLEEEEQKLQEERDTLRGYQRSNNREKIGRRLGIFGEDGKLLFRDQLFPAFMKLKDQVVEQRQKQRMEAAERKKKEQESKEMNETSKDNWIIVIGIILLIMIGIIISVSYRKILFNLMCKRKHDKTPAALSLRYNV